jgi:hypothetical protein
MSILNILVGKIDYIQVAFMYSNSLYYITLLYVFTCLFNYIDIVLCTAYFELYWLFHILDCTGFMEIKMMMMMTVHQLFIDFKKAYDSVRKELLYNILIELGIPMKLARLIKMCLNETE